MSSNSAIPLYVAGAAIVAGGVVQFWAFRRSGWATGFLLGAVVIALLVAGCGYLIYPLNIP
ncbi:MAG TPA: hypothetical protein VHY37_02525 [Tepidisphaeraceae bacterium]|nr:hypothetical protein [Tepidisphaeraceae bacterium]